MGFQSKVDGESAWYHVPWMAYDSSVGGEFSHGNKNKRSAHTSDFLGSPITNATLLSAMSPSCQIQFPNSFESWAVGVYNKWGGYALEQAFPADGAPALSVLGEQMVPAGLPFPTSTMVTKFLTTNATGHANHEKGWIS